MTITKDNTQDDQNKHMEPSDEQSSAMEKNQQELVALWCAITLYSCVQLTYSDTTAHDITYYCDMKCTYNIVSHSDNTNTVFIKYYQINVHRVVQILTVATYT